MNRIPTLIKVTNSGKYNGIYKLKIEFTGESLFTVKYTNPIGTDLLNTQITEEELGELYTLVNKLLTEIPNIVKEFKLYDCLEQVLSIYSKEA